MHQPTDSLSHK